jgi:hypothetical protein
MFEEQDTFHLTDDQVLQLLSGNADDREKEHLEACEICQAELESYRRTLDHLSLWTPPARPAAYGQSIWRQIAPAVRLRARSQNRRRWVVRWAALAASIALFAVALHTLRERTRTVHMPSPTFTASAPASERLLDIAVQDHVRRATSLLTRIEDQPERAVKGLDRDAINNLVAENRLYRQTAEQEKDRKTEQLLSDLETALVVLKHDPARLPVSEVRELRKKLIVAGHSDGLGFSNTSVSDSPNMQPKRIPL